MKTNTTIALATLATLLSTTALAATANSVSNLSNGAPVSLSGTVEDFNNEHSFTLRDGSGTVKVDTTATKSLVLKNGEKVDVTGSVDKGIVGSSVAATTVSEDKNVGQQVGDAINSVTGNDPADNAQAYTVKSLPDTGMVKVQGTVDSVSSAQKFTLKDSTGNVTVAMKSGESASLKPGAGVTVVGYVNKGLLGKSIDATQVNPTR